MSLLLHLMHHLVNFVSQLTYSDSILLHAILRCHQTTLKCSLGLLHVKFRFFTGHLLLMFVPLFKLLDLELQLVFRKDGILQLVLSLRVLS